MEQTPAPAGPSIGIPYARADVDASGYFVICPLCQARFYGPRGNEDGTTKNAVRAYGLHYEATHGEAL